VSFSDLILSTIHIAIFQAEGFRKRRWRHPTWACGSHGHINVDRLANPAQLRYPNIRL
jgi:hypothetical protein